MQRIAITGASGFIGRQLVPLLQQGGAEILVAGRDLSLLSTLFPDISACGYDTLADQAHGFDLLINLAVFNSDAGEDHSAAEAINVKFLRDMADLAQQAEIKRFVHVSTIQALEPTLQTAYATSKRKADHIMSSVTKIDVTTLHLPLVYGKIFSGKLARLNSWPRPIRTLLWPFLAALKPTLHVEKLAKHILAGADSAILSDGQANNLVYRFFKRLLDLGFAFAVIGLFWWGLLLIWVLIRLGSSGPGIFTQARVGQNQRVFTCYKFRTMHDGTKQAGTHEVSTASVTRIGHILRRTKLDELPQVLNLLKGELSLIGPRPCLPVQTELITERTARGVLEIAPGISGLAQIEGRDMSDPVALARRDADYAALQCILLDLRIALATAKGGGQGDQIRDQT